MKKIKHITSAILVLFLALTANAQELPQPSPAASFTQRVGVTDITMNYSRPGVKDREIWGALVPYNEMWRAGANASTKIEFSTDVKINGTDVKAGKYSLYIIPTEKEWTFVLSSYLDGWGVDKYTEDTDVVRVKSKVATTNMTENMLFSMDKLTDNSAVLSLSWEKVKAGFTIEMNTKELSKVILDQSVKDADNSFRTYNNAAKWYMDNGDNAKGLEMAIKSTSQNKRFWNLTVLSEAYYATGDSKMAIKTAKEALALSVEAKYQAYIDRNNKNIADWEGK